MFSFFLECYSEIGAFAHILFLFFYSSFLFFSQPLAFFLSHSAFPLSSPSSFYQHTQNQHFFSSRFVFMSLKRFWRLLNGFMTWWKRRRDCVKNGKSGMTMTRHHNIISQDLSLIAHYATLYILYSIFYYLYIPPK